MLRFSPDHYLVVVMTKILIDFGVRVHLHGAPVLLMYVGGVVLLRNFPFVGEVRLTVLTRFRERAIRSYRTIDRVGPSKRDFTSQSEIIVW